jgi:hypothetical protein
MIDRQKLLADLQLLLKTVEADLLERSESSEVPDVGAKLRAEYAAAEEAERTAQSFTEWRADVITQVAAAWVLSGVFVRFLEDNGLVETPRISGPGERLRRARDEHELYFRSHSTFTDRDYLIAVFDSFTKYVATKDVFGEHNPIRYLPNWPSGDAAGSMIAFFQRIDANTGKIVHDFTDSAWDTRFLGDLYQDLSQAARKKYALLQTPVFVEEFILDRTLDSAIEEFGLARPGYDGRLQADGRLLPSDRLRMIDPACGSGHFLLGGFARLLDRWQSAEPGTRSTVLVQRAIDSVHGVDLNPYAVGIARFRLLLAALQGCQVRKLSEAPHFSIHVACGDSLLHGAPSGDQLSLGWSSLDHVYQPEDREALERILRPGSYHAVVANPPYITASDPQLNAAYRQRYRSCSGQYSLAVPFFERLTSLAIDGKSASGQGGFIGMITANSFMKKEFGQKLVRNLIPTWDLNTVVDTAGATIPGHDTPTALVFLRHRPPTRNKVRVLMGKQGDPHDLTDPTRGPVWNSIVELFERPGQENQYISASDVDRDRLHQHPWVLAGGGANELYARVNSVKCTSLGELSREIGRTTVLGEDDVWTFSEADAKRMHVFDSCLELAIGEHYRDWVAENLPLALYPYKSPGGPPIDPNSTHIIRYLWPFRTRLRARTVFGKTLEQMGRPWYEHLEHYVSKLDGAGGIAFPNVSTHNHFVLESSLRLYNSHTPIIKFKDVTTKETILGILGILNSSLACFWIKQVFSPKSTSSKDVGRNKDKPESNRYEISVRGIEDFPLPEESQLNSSQVAPIARLLVELSQVLQHHCPSCVVQRWLEALTDFSLQAELEQSEEATQCTRRRMVAVQEELDWEVYRLYGIVNEGASRLVIEDSSIGVSPSSRPFTCPTSEPGQEAPNQLAGAYKLRKQIIASVRDVALLESPSYKRLWLGRQGIYGRSSKSY